MLSREEVDLGRSSHLHCDACLQSSDAEMGKSIWTKYDGYLEMKLMWDAFPQPA